MSEDGVFAGSGSFRIDAKRALELISRYQLPDAALFAEPFLRAAAASGPGEIRLSGGKGGFALRFDGRPFSRDELGGVYSALLVDSGPGRERLRDLALGVLTALRARPKELAVASGEGKERCRLSVPRLGAERVEPFPESETETVISASWGWGERAPDWRARLSRPWAAALVPCPVLLDDGFLPRLPVPPRGLPFKRGGARGWLRARLGGEGKNSRLWVYRHGVLAAELACRLPVPVLGCVDDPRLPLDLSLTGVPESPRWGRLKRYLGLRARELLRWELAVHGRDFPELASRLESPDYLELWSERAAWSASLEPPDGPEAVRRSLIGGARAGALADRAGGLRLLLAAWTADWLHQAAAALAEVEDPGDPELRLLGRAPMFLAARGGALALKDAAACREREGAVPYSRGRRADASPDAVWCPSALELGWLKLHFGESIREA